jgi:endonuclease YncB( thermonuclease family)
VPVYSIPGVYKVVGASPDGDSVRFYADDPTVYERGGLRVRLNARGGAQLRLDAVDALETHYTPPRSRHTWHQPAALAHAASDALLTSLGFSGVERAEDGTVTASTPETTRGYILTRFADVYGRPVAFAFPGDREDGGEGSTGAGTDGTDDDTDDDGPDDGGPDDEDAISVGGGQRVAVGGLPTVHLGVRELARSVNHTLVSAGLVYPTFYSKLYVDLRRALARAADAARRDGRGVWEHDATLAGFELVSREQLEDDLVVLPKLFRRLAEFLSLDETGSASLRGFRAFLAQHDDRLFTVPAGQVTGLDTLVRVRGRRVRLTVPPQRIVFSEK